METKIDMNIINAMEIKEIVRRLRQHNEMHHRKERNSFIITNILEWCAEILEDIDKGKMKYVEYGEWKINCDGYYPYCSNCKSEPPGKEMTIFCPNCGARMER